MNRIYRRIEESDKLLIGIGGEWKQNPDKKQIEHIIARPEVAKGYEAFLIKLIKEKDYFIVTTVTDGQIWNSHLRTAGS